KNSSRPKRLVLSLSLDLTRDIEYIVSVMPDIFGVIPARLNSTRFPGKLLHPLNDKPLILYTYENACESGLFTKVFIATDSNEIAQIALSFGAEVIMTSAECQNGTERIAE